MESNENDKKKEEKPKRKSCCGGKREAVTRRQFIGTAAIGAAGLAAASTISDVVPDSLGAPPAKLDPPLISCASATENTIELQVCAGATGAAAGFSLQWMTCADYAANGNAWYASNDERLCKASFSGNANNSNWNLAPNACTHVVIGSLNDADPGVSFSCNEPLDCDTCYVFHAFAHNVPRGANKSDLTPNKECTTAACVDTTFEDGDFCTRSQGYFGSGNDSRSAMSGCFGGDPTGVACTSVAGVPLVTIGGGTYTYAWTTTGVCADVQPGGGVFLMDAGLAALRSALGGGGGSSFFTANGSNAINMGTGGGLASQVATLTLNLAIAGYGQCADTDCVSEEAHAAAGDYADAKLCNFEEGDTFKNDGTPISATTATALNGQTVQDVLNAANAYLGGNGAVALPYSLTSAADLNELVANLNLAFDLKDWGGEVGEECACGGMTAFAESHLCSA